MTTEPGPDLKSDLRYAARKLSAGLWAGIISGFLVGGVGGRLAMFVLRLTSDPSLRGAETDDGFIIGSFTDDTGFLLLICTALGAFGGIVYLGLRGWLPERWRGAMVAALGATLGGSAIIRPDGIDFTLLEPLSLAVVMFIAIPAGGAFLIHRLTERFLARGVNKEAPSWIVAVLPLAGLLVMGPVGAIAIVVAGLIWAAVRKVSHEQLTNAGGVVWSARGAFVLVTLFFAVQLVRDVVEVAG